MSSATTGLDIKERAYVMHLRGDSFKQIGDELGIGKSTAYKYVKELEKRRKGEGEAVAQMTGGRQGQQEGDAVAKKSAAQNASGLAGVPASKPSAFKMSYEELRVNYEKQFDPLIPTTGESATPKPAQVAHSAPAPAITAQSDPIGTKTAPTHVEPIPPAVAVTKVQKIQAHKPLNFDKVLDADKVVHAEIPEKHSVKQPANNAGSPMPEESVKASDLPSPAPAAAPKPERKIKEFTGDDLIAKTFECLPFSGKFKELIGTPSKLFAGLIWGLPKGGKSNFSIRFADYLQEHFGKVVYIAAEEGESVTLQEKFKDIGGSKVTVVETRDRDAIREYLSKKNCDFVFIDSINNAGIDNDFLELLKSENSTKSFVGIVQATKGGNFKGDQALTHNCDFIIKVVDGIAYHHGRFNVASEIPIFEEPLYEKSSAEVRNAATTRSNKGFVKPQAQAATVVSDNVCDEAASECRDNDDDETSEARAVTAMADEADDAHIDEVRLTNAESQRTKEEVDLISEQRTPLLFTPQRATARLPLKLELLHMQMSDAGNAVSENHSGSSEGLSGLSAVLSPDNAHSGKSSGKASKKAKSKKNTESGEYAFGEALLIVGGVFAGAYIYYNIVDGAKKKMLPAKVKSMRVLNSPAKAIGQQVLGNAPQVREPQKAISGKSCQPTAPNLVLGAQPQVTQRQYSTNAPTQQAGRFNKSQTANRRKLDDFDFGWDGSELLL